MPKENKKEKCECVCHIQRGEMAHDIKCCDEMNGVLVAHLQLIKKLKLAGYPQGDVADERNNYIETAEDIYYEPELEELIDNIVEFHHLSRWITKAGIMWEALDKKGRKGKSKSKKGAVAMLFIIQRDWELEQSINEKW